MIYLIAIELLVFLLINYIIAKQDWFSPGVIFCVVFLASILVCVMFGENYGVNFQFETFIVLFLGCGTFTIISFICEQKKIRLISRKNKVDLSPHIIVVDTAIMVIMLIALLLYVVTQLQYVIDVARSVGGSGSITSLIGTFDHYSKLEGGVQQTGIQKSWIAASLSIPCACIEYILVYICSYNYIFFKKYNLLQISYIVIYFITTFFTGSRSPGFRIITAFAIYIIILSNAKKRKKLEIGSALKVGIIGAVIFMILMLMRPILKGTGSHDAYYYIFAYFGGPLANLDTYLQGDIVKSSIFGEQTFAYLINDLGALLNNNAFIYELDLPYLYNNGKFLGNVYTTFYMFMHDFGYYGIIPLTATIAMYYNITYRKISDYNSVNYSNVSLSIIIYGYLFNDLFMLMFSNRFYETVMRISFIERLIMFYVMRFIICNIKIKKCTLHIQVPAFIRKTVK